MKLENTSYACTFRQKKLEETVFTRGLRNLKLMLCCILYMLYKSKRLL